MSELTDSKRAEAARLARDFHAKWAAAFGIAMTYLDEPAAKKEVVRGNLILAGEVMEEAKSLLQDWLREQSPHHAIRCDGRYYLFNDGDLLVVDPDHATDVSEAKGASK